MRKEKGERGKLESLKGEIGKLDKGFVFSDAVSVPTLV